MENISGEAMNKSKNKTERLECFWTAALRNSETKTKHGQKAGGILEGGLQQAAQMYDNSVTSLS